MAQPKADAPAAQWDRIMAHGRMNAVWPHRFQSKGGTTNFLFVFYTLMVQKAQYVIAVVMRHCLLDAQILWEDF